MDGVQRDLNAQKIFRLFFRSNKARRREKSIQETGSALFLYNEDGKEDAIMSESNTLKITSSPETCEDQTVYVLEGNPDEVYDASGNRLNLTEEQKKEIESQF